jgi:hypothetical protein
MSGLALGFSIGLIIAAGLLAVFAAIGGAKIEARNRDRDDA